MSIMPEDVKKTLTCCVDTKTSHYVFEAIIFPCSGNACKKCIEKLHDGKSVKCGFCGQDHSKKEMLKMGANPLVKYLIESYLGGLREQLVNDLNDAREGLSEERMNEDVDLRFSNVEFELDLRIESIIAALHEYREEFMKKMDKMKEKYKRNLKNKGFQEIKNQLDCLNKDTLAADYDDFMRAHNLINESKKKLESYLQQLNQIKMSDQSIRKCKDLIGKLRIPFWKKLISCDEYPINDVESNLYRCCYLKSKNQLIMIEHGERRLINYNLEDNSYISVEHERIHFTVQICTGKNNQIFILDMPKPGENKMVLVFDSDFKYKREFKTNSFDVNFMVIDVNSEPNLLYLSECERNEISVWNSETGESIKTIQIDSPLFIAFTREFTYVTSYTNFETDNEGKFDRITRGSNCIFVLNKQTHEVVDHIEFPCWLKPYGLNLDENENLITMARDLYNNNRISNNLYLYVINRQNKELVDKMKLKSRVGLGSYGNLFFDNKLALLKANNFQLIKFED